MVLFDTIKGWTTKKKIIFASAAALIVIAGILVCVYFFNRGYLATTMRLLRVEGTVSIEDTKGNTKPVIDNIRFQSGDALNTGSDGLASVGLDDTKVVTLQSDSRAEFFKKGKQLELRLTKGALFFEVTEHLQDDESFEIKTSTMTAGIRGTSGYVFYDESGRECLVVTDGKVHVVAYNPDTGEVKETDVLGGQEITVYLYSDRTVDSIEFYLKDLSEEELPSFPITMLIEDPELLAKVCAETGWDPEVLKGLANAFKNGELPGQNPDLTETPTPEPTDTPTPVPTPDPSTSPSPSPDITPTLTPTATPSTSTKPTPTATPTPAISGTPTPSPAPSPTPTPTPTNTPVPSPSGSVTPSPTPSKTPTPTVSPTPGPTPVPTPSETPTPDPSPSTTPDPETPTPEPSETPEPSGTPEPDPEELIPEGYEQHLWVPDEDVYIVVGGEGDEPSYLGYINGDWIALEEEIRESGSGTTYTYTYEWDGEIVVYYTYSIK